jgi:hypothetical protein
MLSIEKYENSDLALLVIRPTFPVEGLYKAVSRTMLDKVTSPGTE